ncbi:uncharacterized protein LOC128655525 [Bombina bombina]|uniref:uncharacterized protein LOC128655525 n=1 Tax=Bombina bombina TaxID=8345 RepID=UPI00235AC4DB|nr:uncharacterized protein LOC128655525 [Bombina bombina]
MEILKLNSAMHEMEEKLFKRASTTQHQITSDLRNQISFLHQQVREKELLSEQDRLLRSKMMADCARLANENNALQIQLLELNKQQDIQRALKEEGYIHDSSSFAHLLSVKDREGQLNSEVKWQQELLELEKSNFKDIMEQITMLNKDSKFQDLSSTTISSRIAEMRAILAKEDHINTELRRDKALLVDHVSNLQTQLGSKDDELLQIFSKIAALEERMSVLKSQQSLDKILHSERWKEIFDMTSSMKTLTTSIADSSLSSRK